MERFMVIVSIKGEEYLVRVMAESLLAAEHLILDQSYCGRHEYGVTGAQAFGSKEMRTENFQCRALLADTVSFVELTSIISKRNDEIKRADEKEELMSIVERKERELLELKAKLKSL